MIEGLGDRRSSTPKGRYLRGRLRRLFGGLAVPAVRFQFEERQQAKFRFHRTCFVPHLRRAGEAGGEIVALRRLEHRPQGDRPEELEIEPEELRLPARGTRLDRAGCSTSIGWVDVYRRLYPEQPSDATPGGRNRGQAWAKNVGWRIDYQIATPGIAARARRAAVYKDAALLRPCAADHRLRATARLIVLIAALRHNG
ncbi:MAG: hypothetical protein MZW92_77340 [Comamonadaceae bacterium]|nr:hypothetical protein [Comamonadaceae bacterium]